MNLSSSRFGLLLFVLTVNACGSSQATTSADAGDASQESEAPDTDSPKADARDEMPPEADTSDGNCVPSSTDDPDDDGIDDNCDGADGVVGHDIYVTTKGFKTNDGTPWEPLDSLVGAIALAQTRPGARVFLARGIYEESPLKVTSDIQIFGGYEESFLGRPDRDVTTLRAPTGLLVQAKGAHLSFSHLTIQGLDAGKSGQASSYGLRILAGDVSIDDVVVVSGDAASGASGEKGADGQTPTTAIAAPIKCNNVVQDIVSAGTTQCPAVNGGAGQPGRDGENGGTALRIECGFLEDPRVAQSGQVGYPGTGGSSCASVAAGSGGCPGGFGTGGTGGGSSVSVLALVGSFSATRSVIRTGLGGAGGDGGQGGAGAPGPTVTAQTGGNGGKGGDGGGGAGGSTIGVLHSTFANIDVDPTTSYEIAPAGPGGRGRGGANAPSGKRLPVLESSMQYRTEYAPCELDRNCCDGLACEDNECRSSP